MAKDYFDLQSDVKFLKDYEEKLSEFRTYVKSPHDENKHHQMKVLLSYMEQNSGRMRRLAYDYAHVDRDPYEWANCVLKRDDEYKYYKQWINHTSIACIEYRDIARTKALYSAVKRIFNVPFGILEAIIGYDIRQQATYKSWMTYIIIGALGLYLAFQAKELIEWVVEMCWKLECLSQ